MSQPNALSLGAHRSGDGDRAFLRSAAPTPGHLLQRFQKVDKFPVRQRPKDPGVMGANEAPAIRDKAVHRLSDCQMEMSAGIYSIIGGKAGNVRDLWYIRSHRVAANYTPNQDAI